MNITTSVLFFIIVISINTINAGNIGRIIGGINAPNHVYPYQVSLQIEQNVNCKVHFCSGSILNEHWILTAAHCLEIINMEDVIIANIGTNYLNGTGEWYKIVFFVIHESYEIFIEYDIALGRIDDKIIFNNYVSPISLPKKDIDYDNKPAIFTGWGRKFLESNISMELQEIKLNLITYDNCKKISNTITQNHICTFTKYGEGLCHGDSGGPLVTDGYQVGIASFVKPCAVGVPDIYTRVSKYVDWIRKTIDKYQ